jgi:hypothetical protein
MSFSNASLALSGDHRPNMAVVFGTLHLLRPSLSTRAFPLQATNNQLPVPTLDSFLAKLGQLEAQLHALSHEYAELYQQFSGDEFAEQEAYANRLEDLVLTATHESATTLGFTKEALIRLAKLTEFRQAYKHFSNWQLSQIIDNQELTAPAKLALKSQLAITDMARLLALLTEIKKAWHLKFPTQTYAQVTQAIA